MLGKLIKYEFRASGRLIPLVYLVTIVLTVAGVLIASIGLKLAPKLPIYSILSFIILILAGAAALIITYVIIFLRFYRGMFGSEGYLAMTLPATPAQLYLSKTIVSAIWLFLSNLVFIVVWVGAIGVIMMTVLNQSGYSITEVFNEFFLAMQTLPADEFLFLQELFSPALIVFYCIISIIGFLSSISQLYFCVTVSHVRPFQSMGIGAGILAFIILMVVNSVLGNLLAFFLPLGLTYDFYAGWHLTLQTMWSYLTDPSASYMTIGLGSYLLPILYAFVLPVFTIRLIKYRVNLK